MGDIDSYLGAKRRTLDLRTRRIREGEVSAVSLAARATVEGGSGVRRIGIRRHAIVSDSGPDLAGFDLGPSSPELQLGVLGSCLAHTVLIQAALQDVPITSLEVEVSATFDPRAGAEGYEDVPVHPHDLSYEVRLDSPADPARIAALHARVETACPILNLLRLPQDVSGRFTNAAPVGRADADLKEINP
ncbi:OsmC family protein [Methylobacterium sp. Leaf93]|uniref:OsmC family protein n=1 Tax=Methylobacterium sp. Leaf93 TaxID=1736249 RepID=UPI0006F9ED7A|nr:OsmC family protein [Methylobacterium sp. Leaf93]KQP09490.1 osmotically inducible protein OsmC [Methylobacterium sp. Leaf93]